MMSEKSLIDVGSLAKPVETLINRVSDAVGGIAAPYQLVRMAKAQAQADVILTKANAESSAIQERALNRMIAEETERQINIESITRKAAEQLATDAKPEAVERDFLTLLFDKARYFSDDEMQSVWARILAGEANSPGSFSRKTIEIMSTLGKAEAQKFSRFCSTCWMAGGLQPLVFDANEEASADLRLKDFIELEALGLTKSNPLSGYLIESKSDTLTIFYFGNPITLQSKVDKLSMSVGHVFLTDSGKQLAVISGAKPNIHFFEKCIAEFERMNLSPYSPTMLKPNLSFY